jgi:hypothetical protein
MRKTRTESEKNEMGRTCINYRINSPDESVESKRNSTRKCYLSYDAVLHVLVRSCQRLRLLCHWCFTTFMYTSSLPYMVSWPFRISVSVFLFRRTVLYNYLHQIIFSIFFFAIFYASLAFHVFIANGKVVSYWKSIPFRIKLEI